jgi:hypothetical protein
MTYLLIRTKHQASIMRISLVCRLAEPRAPATAELMRDSKSNQVGKSSDSINLLESESDKEYFEGLEAEMYECHLDQVAGVKKLTKRTESSVTICNGMMH